MCPAWPRRDPSGGRRAIFSSRLPDGLIWGGRSGVVRVLQRAGLGKALGIQTLTVRGKPGCCGRSGFSALEAGERGPDQGSGQVAEETHAQSKVELLYF